jgi:hypothetical protein
MKAKALLYVPHTAAAQITLRAPCQRGSFCQPERCKKSYLRLNLQKFHSAGAGLFADQDHHSSVRRDTKLAARERQCSVAKSRVLGFCFPITRSCRKAINISPPLLALYLPRISLQAATCCRKENESTRGWACGRVMRVGTLNSPLSAIKLY